MQEKQEILNANEFKPQFGNIKDELFLITFIILCAGLVFTDAYYQRFGFRYQALNFSTLHIIYKGLTMVITSPLMVVPYFLTILMVIVEVYAIKHRFLVFLSFRTPIIYLFIIINLLIIFPLAKSTGIKQASIDIHANTSGLPKINLLESSKFTIRAPIDRYLLFIVDDNFVTYFQPLDETQKGAYPIIKRIAKHEVSILNTNF